MRFSRPLSADVQAADVFYLVNSRRATPGRAAPPTMNALLSRLAAPLLLLWGARDPWVIPARVSERGKWDRTCFRFISCQPALYADITC